ncbi:hypothetical protein AAC387_Pa09g2026 [Persea americana]
MAKQFFLLHTFMYLTNVVSCLYQFLLPICSALLPFGTICEEVFHHMQFQANVVIVAEAMSTVVWLLRL